MRKIIIIQGVNEDSFFIRANEIIYNLEHDINMEKTEFEELTCFIIESDQRVNVISEIKEFEKKYGHEEQTFQSNIPYKGENDSFVYYLRVWNKNIGKDFDVIPLRFFSILRRRYKNKIFMGIKEDISSNYQRISAYMLIDHLSEMNNWKSKWELSEAKNKKGKDEYSLHIDSEVLNRAVLYNQVFSISENNWRFAIHNFGSLNKIIPCIFLDWEWQMLFSDNVSTHINKFTIEEKVYRDNIGINEDLIYKIQRELEQCKGNKWKQLHSYSNTMSDREWKNILYTSIIRDVCLDNLKDGNVLKEENAEEIYEMCKDISILALLLFSSFCHFIYESTNAELSKVELNNLCQSAQDFAQGLLQLMENALEYAEESCFSFRIHAGNSNYFEENYRAIAINQKTYYLEVLLTDINYSGNITDIFIRNLRKRAIAKEIPTELVEGMSNKITLSGFFEPDKEMQKLWDRYYMIAENVTNHYGLQLFNTLVSYYKGYFSVSSVREEDIDKLPYIVNYGKSRKSDEIDKICTFPGTQYSILLPIKKHEEQKRVGIHVHPAFDDIALRGEWENNRVNIEDLLVGVDEREFITNRQFKKYSIRSISEKCERYYERKKIFVINLDNVKSMLWAELFSKAMISFILHHQKEQLRIALINAEHTFMLEFTKFFASFYNKNGKCVAMKSTHLFLCDKEYRTEINFVGQSLAATYAGNELFANAKGEYNQCLEMIQIILSQRTSNSVRQVKELSIVPFELLIKDNGITLFEKRVYNDLMSNIQEESFGCLLKNIHMRVGSKMHITDHFYETYQLFNSSLYNSRFAYLLATKINKEIKAKGKKAEPSKLILVGYDVYSELLILETKDILEKLYKISAQGIIYEQMPHPNFRMWKDDMIEGQFVIIVPTSTTLTTHGKIIVELARKIGCSVDELDILINVALILIRDSSEKVEDGYLQEKLVIKNNLTSIEKNYWNCIQNDTNIREVITKTTKPERVSYHVLVESEWQEPLSCRSCYPTYLLDEKPIIEVNRGSVVPMIMAGPKDSSIRNEYYLSTSRERLNLLEKVMYYGHGQRKNNHFKYYFKTDELMQIILENEESKIDFKNWLIEVKEKVKKQQEEQDNRVHDRYQQLPYIYNILVAPIHETNAQFLTMLNAEIFEGVPIVLYLDSDREYRENILSKYSNLTVLYNNILRMERTAIINFHYVDDSINSGVAFRRTHSLLQTLFPAEAYLPEAQVQVNLFQNVFILLNRNSNSSIKGYTHNGTFFSYISLNVSNLRNHHENACAVCSEVSDYKKLKERTAINRMVIYWKDIIEDKRIRDVRAMVRKKDLQERYFRRLLCTHEINSELAELGWKRNIVADVQTKLEDIILERLMNDSLNEKLKMEYVMSYFVVLSRPYLSYRKSILDVVFPLMLEVMENILNEDKTVLFQSDSALVDYVCKKLVYNKELDIQKDFLKVMISSLSKLGACYLIRVQVMNRIFVYAKKIGFEINEFELFYGAAIKRLITLSKDETIGLWLEHLLLEKREYGGNSLYTLSISKDFEDLLFYENTYIITDATEELLYKKVKYQKEIEIYIKEYYFDNFRKLMNIDFLINQADSIKSKNRKWNFVIKMMLGMVRLRRHLLEEDSSVDDYYLQLLRYIEKITNANYICIYGIDVLEQIYIIGSTIDSFYNTDFFREIERSRKDNVDTAEYLKDSVYHYSDRQVVLCLTEKNVNDKCNETTDVVWLMLEFPEKSVLDVDMACDEIKFAIRNILVHRYLLWERLKEDFRKDSFRRIKELSIKNELLSKSKAGSHTPDAILRRIESNLKRLSGSDEKIMSWAGSLLQLATDSLISKLYVESIREENANMKNQNIVLSFEYFKFTTEIQSLLKWLSYVNKDKREDDPTYAEIIVEENAREICFYCPDEKRFYDLYIIAAIVQNAVKHGNAKKDNKVEVKIKLEGNYLVFENALKHGYKNKIKDNGYATGITIAALKYYFSKYYGMNMRTEIVEIDNTYRVKIPVVAQMDYEGEG